MLMEFYFIFRVCKDGFKNVCSFEDNLHTGMLKDSSKFLTEARNRDENITLDF